MKPLVPLTLLAALLLLLAGCDITDDRPDVSIIDLQVGEGTEAVLGAEVTVHYTGRLTTGDEFDSSAPGEPVTFTLGEGQVIEGWERGVRGMRVGGKRRLIIPPQLAYGNQAQGCPLECEDPNQESCENECAIPPNATLVFDIDLLAVIQP